MSIELDPQHSWRSAALAGIPVTIITFDFSDDALREEEAAAAVQGLDTADWLDSVEASAVPRELAADAYTSRELNCKYEVRDIRPVADVSGCITATDVLPYDYIVKPTQCVVTGDGDHMPVLADVNSSARAVLRSACSVDEVAKAAGIKLPRVQANAAGQRTSPLLSTEVGVSDFEALRGVVLRRTANSDYGLRLFQLARVVCHAVVAADASLPTKSALSSVDCRSILASQTPLISTAELRQHSFWYIGTEDAATYRAFLIMGACGLENFASSPTVYSQAVVGPEVVLGPKYAPIVFVRVGSLTSPAAPTALSYDAVLTSPAMCMSYYMAYANSLGIGDEALLVLQQAACVPFISGAECRLPYRPDYPCLDATPYLLSQARIRKTAGVVDVHTMVASACVRGLQLLVGLGARIGGFETNSAVESPDVLAQTMFTLGEHKAARLYSREVLSALGSGECGLEWVSPFHPDLAAGVGRAVDAFRRHAWLLSTYARDVCVAYSGVFSGGVDMGPALLAGTRARSRSKEVMMLQLAARLPVQLLCDAITRNSVPANVQRRLGYVRAWRAVCRFVKFSTAPLARHRSALSSSTDSSTSPTPRKARVSSSGPMSFMALGGKPVRPSDSVSVVGRLDGRGVPPTRAPPVAVAPSAPPTIAPSLYSTPTESVLPSVVRPPVDNASALTSEADDSEESGTDADESDDDGAEADDRTVVTAISVALV